MPLPAILAPMLGDALRALIDRALPDPAQRAAAELELKKLEADGTFEQRAAQVLALAQIDTNRVEAAAPDAFRGGWRPAVGWVCAAALAVQFVAGPLLEWGAAAAGHPVPPVPRLDDVLWELLAGLLGLGTLRTIERVRGRA